MASKTLGDKNSREGMPDILDAIAAMSSDAVPTPPVLARAMLDLLPDYVWSDPTLKWLDPAVKSGSILREIASRLMDGLAEWEPDVEKRANHVLRNMVYGVGITRLHGEMGRRSVYVSRDATGPKSLIEFETPEGNIPFIEAEHTFPTNKAGRITGNCEICSAPPGLERGEDRENYAYAFIHHVRPKDFVGVASEDRKYLDMKFDVIVGNPPYQTGDGRTSETPIYQHFIESAIALEPKYLSMIVPSRWFAGGKGLDEFRASMIADRRLAKIVDNPKVFDCFPGVKIRGGVNYFLWDANHDADCEFSMRIDGLVRETVVRDLRDGDGVLVRNPRAVGVIDKVRPHLSVTPESMVTGQFPFGQSITTNFSGADTLPFSGSVPLIFGSHVGHIDRAEVSKNVDWIDQYKVLIPKASSGDTDLNDDGLIYDVVLGAPIALAPGSVCTQTYLVAGVFDSAGEAENYAHYLASKFVRFLVLQRKVTQDVRPGIFRFVPLVDFGRRWTDEDLYEHFGLSEDEVEYIEATIKPRSVNLSLDSPIPASHLPGGEKYRPPGKRAQVDVAEDDE